MTPELQEAEVRVREALANAKEPSIRMNWRDDFAAWTLARAWLAERDEAPMTCQWLADVGFKEYAYHDGDRDFSLGAVSFYQRCHQGVPVAWKLYLCGNHAQASACPSTRGAVRRLCESLGIPLKETT